MRSLFKIIRRYVLTAVLITLLILLFNCLILFFWGNWLMKEEQRIATRRQIEEISWELVEEDGRYEMTEVGYRKLETLPFIWGMVVKNDGSLGWTYRLPAEIPRRYTMADMSVLSKWYLEDYPVFTWICGDDVLVLGREKESVARFSMQYSIRALDHVSEIFFSIMVLNLLLVFCLALFFGYRFYRSLRPIAQGIEQLSNKETIALSEKGITDELARRLNQTSKILERQNSQLARRDHARTDWIAGVSHDIRTPLSLILGYADSLSRDMSLDEKGRRAARSIRRQSMQIKKLIEDLNLTSKLEYDAQPLRIGRFFPASFLRQVVADHYNEGILGDCQIDLEVDGDVEHVQIDGDRQILERAFRNLIGNSVRYAPGCRIQIHMYGEGPWIRIDMFDSGPGIPPEVVAIVQGRTRDPDIHVMGLRVAAQIIRAHRGRMEFILRDGNKYDVSVLLSPSLEE